MLLTLFIVFTIIRLNALSSSPSPPTPHTRTCRDFDNLNAALLDMIREQRKVSTGEDLGVIKKKDSMKDAEDKLVQVGKKARNEVSSVHGCRISLVQ